MSYLVLALKWRPQTFDEVVGQATVTRTLRNALSSGRLGHAFLLSGARGVGKTTTARILAKALNCAASDAPTADPCGKCPACTEIAAGTCLDVQEIDGATHNGVEQVRELRESARYNPARDRFKIWIIDEVHMLSTGAFNALLKTLEEPPPRVKFIFATTEYHKLPDTILSRCQQYDFRMIPARELVAHLRKVADGEAIRVSDEALARIARAAEGSVRDALSLFDQVLSFSGDEVNDDDLQALLGLIDRELLTKASQAVAESDTLGILNLVEELSDYGADYRNFTRELLLHIREILLLKLAPEGSPLLSAIVPEERERLRPLAEAFSQEDLLRFVDLLTQAERELRNAEDPRVTLELALLKLVELRRLQPFGELVARVEALASGAPPQKDSRRVRPGPDAAEKAVASQPFAASDTKPVEKASASTEKEPSRGTTGGRDAVLEAMLEHAQTRPSLLQPLRAARVEIDGDTLSLGVTPDFAAFAETHLDEYQELARKASGRRLKVKLATTAAPDVEEEPQAAPSSAEIKRERLMKEAAREPAVQEVLELFNGKIVDVREAEPKGSG